MVAERLYDAVRWIQGRYVFSSESFKVKVEAFKFDEMYACGFTQMTIDQLCEASQWVQDLCGCKSLGSQATVETSKIVTMSMCELSLWLQNHYAKQFNGFNTHVNVVLEASMQPSKQLGWILCLCLDMKAVLKASTTMLNYSNKAKCIHAGYSNGYRPIVQSNSMVSRLVRIQFLKLSSNCRNIQYGVNVNM